MNKEKPYFLKRLIAYFIDLIIVALLAGILSTVLIKNDNYTKESEKLMEITNKYINGNITKEEYNEETKDINYYLTKESVGVTIISLSVSLVYYVILCYYCNGVTLGKSIMRIRIVSANDKKLHLGHYLIRGLLVNMMLSNIISVAMVLLLSKETFIEIYSKVSSGLTIFMLVTLIVMMYREDGRGLHDLAANTKVVKILKKQEEQKDDNVTDAKIVEEKEVKKTSKKITKKGSDNK